MAISFNAISSLNPSEHPSGFTNPTANVLSSPYSIKQFDVEIAASGVANSTASTGLDNLLAALVTYAEGTLATAMKLDSSATVTGNIYLKKVARSVDGASIYNTGTDEYLCTVFVEWE